MAKQGYKYDDVAGTIEVINENQVLPLADMAVQLAAFRQVRQFDDATREKLALGAPGFFIAQGQFSGLADLDQFLDDEIERFANLLDLTSYAKAPFTIGGTADHDWFIPEAIESFTDETVGGEAVNAIDAVGRGSPDPNDPENSTYWQSESTGVRQLTLRLRDYSKKVEGIRLRVNASDGRAALQDVTIKCSNGLGMIDDPSNVVATGIAFDNVGQAMVEYIFPSPKYRCRYIKIEASQSAHSRPDELRIRSFQARVGVINFDK